MCDVWGGPMQNELRYTPHTNALTLSYHHFIIIADEAAPSISVTIRAFFLAKNVLRACSLRVNSLVVKIVVFTFSRTRWVRFAGFKQFGHPPP